MNCDNIVKERAFKKCYDDGSQKKCNSFKIAHERRAKCLFKILFPQNIL